MRFLTACDYFLVLIEISLFVPVDLMKWNYGNQYISPSDKIGSGLGIRTRYKDEDSAFSKRPRLLPCPDPESLS